MPESLRFYIGTYTDPIIFGTGQVFEGKGEGIYLLEMDLSSGALEIKHVFPNIVNPSYITFDPSYNFLYAVNELKEYQGKASGSVSAFSISQPDGVLTFINKQATSGTDPCHVTTNPQGNYLYVSNFMSGSVAVFPINPDGSLGQTSQFIQHSGSSIDPSRQQGPHAHALVFTPDGRFAFVPDLGLDKLMIYQSQQDPPMLVSSEPAFIKTIAGAGPRHCTFSPDCKYCYLINELDCTILTLAFDKDNGSFTELQRVSTLPEGVSCPGNSCADIHITPDGKFLYGSNRGHNSLAIYRVDRDYGMLDFMGCHPCGGAIPRSFEITPAGDYLLCANQDSDNIAVFRIDPDTGHLSEISEINIPTPVCIKTIK